VREGPAWDQFHSDIISFEFDELFFGFDLEFGGESKLQLGHIGFFVDLYGVSGDIAPN